MIKRLLFSVVQVVVIVGCVSGVYAHQKEQREGEAVIRVAINGFGRIGRNFLRSVLQDPLACKKIDVVAINIGPAKIDFCAHMFKYDTLLGTYPGSVELQGNTLCIDGHSITLMSELNPALTQWGEKNIDWVIECTGVFTKREGAQKHLEAGAKHVLISAPAKNEDISIVLGVNHHLFDDQKHKIVSLGSCTTNAFMNILKVLDDSFGIENGFMTTVHAYTNTQVLLDVEGSDLRRSRAAALNIIPTSTGAAKMLTKIIPHLADKVHAVAIRVPVGKVSLIDLTFTAQKDLSADVIHQAFIDAADGQMQGVLGVSFEPLVSSDYSGNSNSVTIDTLMTDVHGKTAKIFGWYDNEWGYSVRLKDFLLYSSK